MKKITFILLFSVIVNDVFAQTANTTLDAVRDKTELFIGFNRRSDKGSWWSNSSFASNLADINPDIMRFPGGTQANYWDWSTGEFIPNSGKTMGQKEVVSIADFVAGIPTTSKIVYVPNLARPTPATGITYATANEATLKSAATLNLKIQDYLNAIAAFGSHVPYAIEVGNEFYFGNEEGGIFHIEERADTHFYSGWDTNTSSAIKHDQGSQTNKKKDATVTNVKFYLSQCKEIVSQIKAVYPNMKFVLVATKGGTGDSSRDRWNNTMFDELNNNPTYATLVSDVYALTQHHYLTSSYGLQTNINDAATAKEAIAEGIDYPMSKQADYDAVPSNFKIWFTEYGETKEIADETWASGVRYAALALSWINRGDKVGQLGYHHVSDNTLMNTADNDVSTNTVNVGTTLKKTPIAIAAELLLNASSGMTEMQRINFTNNPISISIGGNDISTLYGYKYKNATKETLFIINLNDISKTVKTDNLFTYTGQYTRTQYYSNQPYIAAVYDGHANISSSTSSTATNTFNAPNFSITVIERLSAPLAVEQHNKKAFTIYPNPVINTLTIKGNTPLNHVIIRDVKGSEVIKLINPNNQIDLSTIANGFYTIELKSSASTTYHKFIKTK